MQVELGQAVFGSDGERIGRVEGLVIDAGTKEVRQIVVAGEPLGDERLVDLSAAQRSGPDGLLLDLDAATAARLPRFVREEHVAARREDAESLILPGTGTGGTIFYDNPRAGAGYPGSGSFFDPAPIDPPVVEVQSNLAETEVMLHEGTDVVGADGHKVGTVDQVFTGERGRVEGFLVKEGFFFKRHVSVPIDWIAEVDDDRVLLRLTADEAERQGGA